MDPRLKEIVDNFDAWKIGLDDSFQFHCTECGKCCINREDILLTPRDLFNAAKALMRQQTLQADAAEMHVLTKNLAMAKMKLALLKRQIQSLPPAYQDTVSCLFAETEQYIKSLRIGRNSIVGRRRT